MKENVLSLVELKSVNAGYKNTVALENVDFTVEPGDFIGVIGPNGGGKTTLVKVILGEISPFTGTVKYKGSSKETVSIGYLPQKNQFDNKFPISVGEMVMSGLPGAFRPFSRFSKADKACADDVMKRFGIIDIAKRQIGTLSGGQLQRAMLARAVISSPELLILDEPDTHIDNVFEMELYRLLSELNKEITVILVSHDAGMITSVVKTIACVNRTLHYHPSNEITRDLLKSYKCPIDLIGHDDVPHRVLKKH